MSSAVEGNRDNLAASLFGFGLHLRRGHVVRFQDLWKLRKPHANEAGVFHYVEDVRERNARKIVPEVRAGPHFTFLFTGRRDAAAASAPANKAIASRRLSRAFISLQLIPVARNRQ